MRRGVGVGAIKKKKEKNEQFGKLADKLEATQEAHVEEFLASFKVTLEGFAAKHKKKIRSDPLFRSRFTSMCYEIGVDPLRSSKGFWSETLGIGDYFFELGVKIIEACAKTRDVNGGLMTLDELGSHLDDTATKDDLRRAIAKLHVLGNGFRLVDDLVFSVPLELHADHTIALDLARATGTLTNADLERRLRGNNVQDRSNAVLTHLATDGFAWIDQQSGGHPSYYFPSLWLDAQSRRTSSTTSTTSSSS